MLVCKKERKSTLLHQLFRNRCENLEGLLPTPIDTGSNQEPSCCRVLLLLGLKGLGFGGITMDEASKQYTTFTVENIGFCMQMHAGLGCVTPLLYSKDWCRSVWVELNLIYCFDLPGWHDHLFKNGKRNTNITLHCVWGLLRAQSEAQAKCEFFQNKINYLAHHVSQGRCMTQQRRTWSLCGWNLHCTTTAWLSVCHRCQ